MAEESETVLVTGGAGFIGSHFVDAALLKGHRVKILDNLSSGRLEHLSSCKGEGRLAFAKGDIRSKRNIANAIKGVDSVVHLAALVSVQASLKQPEETALTNSIGTLSLLEECVKRNVRRFVFASSCSVYGNPKYLPIDERHPTVPLSPYAASKLAGEAYCDAFSSSFGLSTVCLRFFNVFGTRQSSGPYAGVITKSLQRLALGDVPVIYGDGKQTRDFVYVEDVVQAIFGALQSENSDGEKINVGSGRAVTINEVVGALLKATGKQVDPVYENMPEGEILHSVANIEKAERLLDYHPRKQFEEGLREVAQAYL